MNTLALSVRRTLTILACSALVAAVAPAQDAASPAELGRELIEAAQQEDVERAKRLLAAGADVDTKTRYGATPLFFAADKGNLELVELLLDKDPALDVVDTFYEATPLTFALMKVPTSPKHRAVVLELLAKGSGGAGQALGFAASTGDDELARAALEVEGITVDELRSALSAAQAQQNEELGQLISSRLPEEPEAASQVAEVPVEVLGRHQGDFKSDDLGLSVKIFLAESDLKLQVAGQGPVTLRPSNETTFSVVEVPGITVTFRGRGGTTEGFVLDQNGLHDFVRVQPEDSSSEDAGDVTRAAALPEVERQPTKPWPGFRGTAGSGIGDGQGAPTTWNAADGTNIRWKTPIPGIALSSPIVWGDRVFVTTAISSSGDSTFRTGLYGDVDAVQDDSEHTWKVYALDRKSGDIVWERTAAQGVPKVQRHTKSSHANPTPVTDGRHLVVHFGSEGIFTYDFDGELLWKRDFGKLVSGWFYDASYEWGFSSSPILHDGRVIVQTDIQKGSFIAAFDVTNGKELWRTERDEIPTWGTPAILPSPKGDEVVTNGTTIRGYDAKTGEELWTLGPNSEVTVGTPVIADGLAYITGGYPPVQPIYAVRPGGRGDLSLTDGESESEHIAWSTKRGGTYIPSPLVYEGILYMTHNNGRLSAHDAKTGERLYRARVGRNESLTGSPVAADGKLYFTSEEGTTFVVRSGPVFELLAENHLGEIVGTTPAISGGVMYLRGMDHVYAIAEGAGD